MPCATFIANASIAEGDSDDDAAGSGGGGFNGALRWGAFGALVIDTDEDGTVDGCNCMVNGRLREEATGAIFTAVVTPWLVTLTVAYAAVKCWPRSNHNQFEVVIHHRPKVAGGHELTAPCLRKL